MYKSRTVCEDGCILDEKSRKSKPKNAKLVEGVLNCFNISVAVKEKPEFIKKEEFKV